MQATADGVHVNGGWQTLDGTTNPQTFTLPFTGTRTDGGNTYVRGSVWANGADMELVDASITWATASGLHHGSAHVATTVGHVSQDWMLVDPTAGRIAWTLDPGVVGTVVDPSDPDFLRWSDGDYSLVTGELSVTVQLVVP